MPATNGWWSKPTAQTTHGGVSSTVPADQKGGASVEQPAISTAQKIFDNDVTNSPTAIKVFGGETPNVQETPNTSNANARITMYDGKDDQFGSETASANRFGKLNAIPGETIAVNPKVIPYGSYVQIPGTEHMSAHGDGIWYAHDTGSAVKSGKANNGGNVIDMYAPGHNLNDPKYNKDFAYNIVKQPKWANIKS